MWHAEAERMVALKTIKVIRRAATHAPTTPRAGKLGDLERDLGKLFGSASHCCIVELIAAVESVKTDLSGAPCEVIEIFMGLEHSTLKHMITNHLSITDDHLGNTIFGIPAASVHRKLLYSILLGLEFLREHRIVHRGVDPACTLYSWTGGCDHSSITFKLGGVGLGNYIDLTPSSIRTEACFKAPELDFETDLIQENVGVWSLFITMLWCMDVKNFREELPDEANDRDRMMKIVVAAADESVEVSDFRQMGVVDWRLRASAAQMLHSFSVSDPTRPRGVVPVIAPYPYPQASQQSISATMYQSPTPLAVTVAPRLHA